MNYYLLKIFVAGGPPIPEKISSPARSPRIPPAADGIQVNFCKNPTCKNFGVLPREHIQLGWHPKGSSLDTYSLALGGGRAVPRLQCHLCNEEPPIKSNQAIAEERARLLRTLQRRRAPTCPNAECPNHTIPVASRSAHFQSFGRTRSGSHRYRCKACHRTFAVGTATMRQRLPYKNRTVFALLMNKSPLRRVCEVAGINENTVYRKLDFLAAQCQAFAADREQRLLAGLPIRRLYLATDRQDYMVNWTQHEDRRNVILHAVATADNETGYVFGIHLNYDSTLNAAAVEADAALCGDLQTRPPFRRYARCWLAGDYAEAVQRQAQQRRIGNRALTERIREAYVEAAERDDVEISETQDANRRLPAKGMQIHAEYTLYGHFFFLRELFRQVEKVRFFLDQDSGMRAGCLAAFQPEIAARQADAFYVRIAPELTITEKRATIATSRKEFQRAREAHPDLSENAVKLLLITERMQQMAALGKWQDRWLIHPFPHMSEPQKAVCYLTDYGDYDQEHLAWLYNKASLHGINRFFMQIRRRLSILERPIATASGYRRLWHGYSAYNPETISKLLTLFRVFYNYCLAGSTGYTPAMRLGLAKGKVTLEDITYF